MPDGVASETARWLVYVVASIVLLGLGIAFLLWSLGYMESAMIASSLLSALIGFTLISGGLYALRLSAYVYAVRRGGSEE